MHLFRTYFANEYYILSNKYQRNKIQFVFKKKKRGREFFKFLKFLWNFKTEY